MSAVLAINAADTLITLLLDATAAAQKYGAIMATARAQGREVNLEDLKGARAQDDVAAAALDAAIKAHGG